MQEVINLDYRACTLNHYVRSDNNDNKYVLTSYEILNPTVTYPQ